ncbi:hypothetical protein [Erwinia sp.]|uniref:hypothetical protein n=1 Tax=Erwinia citreus TaxID=558 RepID=UPI003C7736AB
MTDEDQEHHIMLGEAAMSLIFSREVINPSALLQKLQAMAGDEEDDERLMQIWQARNWLLKQKCSQNISPHQGWLTSSDSHNDPESRGADIRLRPSQSDEAEN